MKGSEPGPVVFSPPRTIDPERERKKNLMKLMVVAMVAGSLALTLGGLFLILWATGIFP